MACKKAAMSWIFNGAGSFEKLPVQEDGPRTCHSERSEESQNECAEAKHIKIQDFSCLTTFHCNSIFALLLSFPKSLNFLLSPQALPVSPKSGGYPENTGNKKASAIALAYGVGKLPTSRRYNQLPLLRSSPGGFARSWPYRTYPYVQSFRLQS